MPSHGSLRWGLVLGTLWQSFFSTGIVFGWAGLLLLLKDGGVYSELCPAQTAAGPVVAICSARSVALNLIFSSGAVTAQASGVVVGSVLDCFGPRKTMMLGNALVIVGSLLFAETPGHTVDRWALPLAYALFGFGGNMIHLSGFSLANLFPSDRRPTLVATLVMTFTLSGFTFQLMLLANMHFGMSLHVLFRLLAGLQGSHLLVSATQWPSLPLQPGDQLSVDGWRIAVAPADSGTTRTLGRPSTSTQAQASVHMLDRNEQADPKPSTSAADIAKHATVEVAPYGALPVHKQLRHPEFVFLTVFFAVLSFTLRFYMGAVREQLMQGVSVHADAASASGTVLIDLQAEEDEIDLLVEVFNVIIALGFACVPLYTCIVDR